MAQKNAPYYSCKAGRPETLKSHRLHGAALKAAGEYGQLWDTEASRQRQVHWATSNQLATFTPDGVALDMKALLVSKGLIAPVPE